MTSKTGSWCHKNGITCEHHKFHHISKKLPIPYKNCTDSFFGPCTKGSCYMPPDIDARDKKIRIEQCTSEYFGYWYSDLIGMEFDVDFETADTYFIRIDKQPMPISANDCTIFIKEEKVN